MESRIRTILPVVGIVLVVIIALVAFFITRRVSNSTSNTTTNSSSASTSLILPSASNTAVSTAAPHPTLASMATTPNTGIVESPIASYQETFTESGFKDPKVSVASGVAITWKNTGTTAQSVVIDGLSSGSIAPGKTFSYLFDEAKQITVVLQPSSTSQTISVQ